jgi:hypothetical protein
MPRRWKLWLAITAGGLLYLLVSTRVGRLHDPINGDATSYYAYAQSVLLDGDLDFANNYQVLRIDETRSTPTGRLWNKYPVGTAVLNAPFFLAGHAVAVAGRALGASWSDDGYSLPEQLGFALGSIFWALVGLELAFRLVVRWSGEPHATFATTAWLLGSSLAFYVYRDPGYAHACSFFAVTAFLAYERSVGRLDVRSGLILGALAGLMTLVENQNLLVTIVPLVLRWPELRRAPLLIAVAALGALVGFLPQMAAWQVLFGRPVAYSYQGEGFDFIHPHLIDVLFSTRHGLITWTPIAGLAIAGLGAAALRDRTVRPYLLALALQWLVNGAWWCWWFGWSFGARKFLSVSTLFMLGLALLSRRVGHRRGLWAVVALLILWNAVLALLLVTGSIPGMKAVGGPDLLRGLRSLLHLRPR